MVALVPTAALAETTSSTVAADGGPKTEASVPGPDLGGPDGRLVAGVLLLGAGGLAAIGGGIGYSVLSAQTDSCAGATAGCVDENKSGKSASIVALVLGGAGVAAGIPLIITGSGSSFGSWRNDKRNAAIPELRVGVAAGSVTWSF